MQVITPDIEVLDEDEDSDDEEEGLAVPTPPADNPPAPTQTLPPALPLALPQLQPLTPPQPHGPATPQPPTSARLRPSTTAKRQLRDQVNRLPGFDHPPTSPHDSPQLVKVMMLDMSDSTCSNFSACFCTAKGLSTSSSPWLAEYFHA